MQRVSTATEFSFDGFLIRGRDATVEKLKEQVVGKFVIVAHAESVVRGYV